MWLLLGGLATLAYLGLAPAVVNGDGLGYLRAASGGALYPGHLGYVPLLRLVGWALGAHEPVALLLPARLVSAVAAGITVATLGGWAARRWNRTLAGWAAGVGLAASYALLAAGSDVESYAPALAALVGALACAAAGRPILAGLLGALAALLHVENLLLFPAALWLLGGRRQRLSSLGAAAPPLAVSFGLAIGEHGLAWLFGASHGFRYPVGPATPAIALYGAAKALVFSPYPYEASWGRVLIPCALGLLALGLLIFTCARAPLPRAAWLAWLLPYAAIGCLFFASDQERWIFLLPLLWLAAAARPERALAIALFLGVANLALEAPRRTDDRLRQLAALAAEPMAAGDLVVGPGHDWDEYIGFYEGPKVTHFPLVYWAGALGPEPLRSRLAASVADAWQRGHAVWLVRLQGDTSPLGWKELARFGIEPSSVSRWLPPGRRTTIRERDGVGVERFAPPGSR